MTVPNSGGKVSKVVRGIKAALNRTDGSTRSADLNPKQEPFEAQELNSAREQMAELRHLLERRDQEIARLRTKLLASGTSRRGGNLDAKNIIWMFGSGRTGSNWLGRMMGEITNHYRWQEPMVGALFAWYYTSSMHHDNEHFIMGSPYRELWLRSIRSFVLEGANARFPEIVEQGYLVIREPTGSAGAPLLVEALPESRMIFLIRDPRDVVASLLDGSREGGWLYNKQNPKGNRKRWYRSVVQNPDAFVKARADMYLLQVGRSKQAYEAHQGHKVLVKYEDLRADTLGSMKHIYATLEIDVDEKELSRAVEKHSWENIPEENKGEGKFHRKATPGGWRNDLTRQQVKVVEKITAPLLDEFYPAREKVQS